MPANTQPEALPATVEAKLNQAIAVGDISSSEAVAIGHYARAVVNKQVIEHQEILNVSLDVARNPALFQQMLLQVMIEILGLESASVSRLGRQDVPQNVRRQIRELQLATEKNAEAGVPLTAKAAYDLGMLAAYERDREGAIAYFRQAADLDPAMSEAFKAISWLEQSLAMTALHDGDHEAAADAIDRAVQAAARVDPPDARSLVLLGYCAKTRAQIATALGIPAAAAAHYAEARERYLGALHLDPKDAGLHNGLANIYYAAGEYDRAIASGRRAIELAGNYTAAYKDLAECYLQKMRIEENSPQWPQWHEKALLALEQAYELAPFDSGLGEDFQGRVLERINELKRAWRRHKILYD
jgi:tetratricopeptide (TPR) repeat protein